MSKVKQRILTGDRPTGRLHLGHYVGSLQTRVALQDEYDTFIEIADIQALTTHFERPQLISDSITQVAIDNLSVGLDPEKATLFLQSRIPAIAELTVFFSMFCSVNVLRHNPTVKTETQNYGYDDMTCGFLGYPVSQTADIAFCHADLVPVGEDQKPHIELARRLVRRFNDLYCPKDAPLLTEPKIKLSEHPRLAGLDGNAKMGKSLGNAIYLSDSAKEVADKVRSAKTDPARIRKDDPGHPEVCTVADYHKVFSPNHYEEVCASCRAGTIGCVACKKLLTEHLNNLLDPFREKRAFYEENPQLVQEIIQAGCDHANKIGNDTSTKMREAMHLVL